MMTEATNLGCVLSIAFFTVLAEGAIFSLLSESNDLSKTIGIILEASIAVVLLAWMLRVAREESSKQS